ncbi:hypothetical protein FACS189445_0230 [Spirochaetia bacterium]|nr:hypothetical protein FACS189445_0230 [Spirochaetia bacterium]
MKAFIRAEGFNITSLWGVSGEPTYLGRSAAGLLIGKKQISGMFHGGKRQILCRPVLFSIFV